MKRCAGGVGLLLTLATPAAVFIVTMLLLGQNPLVVLTGAAWGAVGSVQGLNRLAARTIPLLLLGAGLVVAFRARFWYIGMNGAMIVGAIVAAGIGLYHPDDPGWLVTPAMLLAAVVSGALWALVPAWLRVRFGSSEIITSLMLNYVALRIADFLSISYWKDPNGRGFPGTAPLSQSFWLPRLPDTNVHLGLVFGLLALAGVAALLGKTVIGLRVAIVGQSPRTAAYLGFDAGRLTCLVAALAGALAALAGASEVMGLNHRLESGITQDLGYTAILVASLAALRPWLVLPASILVAALLVGGDAIQIQLGTPSAAAGVLLWAVLYAAVSLRCFRRASGP
ncbi:MAG: ABC transporter permease [Chloroflexi bacterium]|nr:ABC transporter permease [Chloroflexota bacterium]